MTITNRPRRLASLAAAVAIALGSFGVTRAADAPPVEPIPWDTSTKAPIQRLKLKRLVNAQLAAVVRKPEKGYELVYEAMLTRKGMERKYRQEAADALAKINGSSAAVELIRGIGLVPEDERATAKELVGLLMAQKPADLAAQKDALTEQANTAENPEVRKAAYAALAVAGGKADAVWDAAAAKDDGVALLLGGVGLIADAKVRGTFAEKVLPLVAQAKDEAQQVAAIDAASYLPGREADAVKALAAVVAAGPGAKRDAAVKSLGRIPAAKYPKDAVAPLVAKVLEAIGSTPADDRVKPAGVDAAQLVTNLSNALGKDEGAAARKQLRGLVPALVKVRTYREQMLYDTAYFVVEAGKPVQVSLENDDAMQHNIVIVQPGTLGKVAGIAAGMQPPSDENAKAFVPEVPEVVAASKLANPDETLVVSFAAPAKPGEYPYVCTFPGHAERMNGIMLVVPDIDAWEKAGRTPPTDPKTKKPYASDKVESMEGPAPAGGHQH